MKYILIVALFLSYASAWWGTGHLLTARIAQNFLEKEDNNTFAIVNTILQKLKETDPAWTDKEDQHSFVECATFADDIKFKGGGYQKGWHFIDEPFLDQGGDISDFDFTFDEHNVTEVITALQMWFNKSSGYTQTYEYEQIMNHTYKDHTRANGMSTAMRFLIHYTGDVHQPLHATSRVDKDYPRGDFGGNSVPLQVKEGAKNLHSVWDSVIYTYTGYGDLPYSDDAWATVSQQAEDLISKYESTIDATDANILDSRVWAHESFEISKSTVYPTVQPNMALTDAYIAKAKPIAERQLVLGGRRLANMLKSFHLQAFTAEDFEIIKPQKEGKLGKMINKAMDHFQRVVGYV